jgi:methionyl-tRNA formyltransferase
VSRHARTLGAKVIHPESVRDPGFAAAIRAEKPDVAVVAAYGKLLPPEVLAVPPMGTWNVHPSLLPRWRGPAPIHRTVWSGDEDTGVSIMQVTPEMDAGPVALQFRTPVSPRDTRGDIEERLSIFGAELMVTALAKLEAGSLPVTPQDDRRATYAAMFKPEETEMMFSGTCFDADRLRRALAPAPMAWFRAGGIRVKVRDVRPVPHQENVPPGTLLERIPGGAWRVACDSGSLWIGSVLPEGKSWMSMDAFVQGKRLKVGGKLG